jgi:hypothetical protein
MISGFLVGVDSVVYSNGSFTLKTFFRYSQKKNNKKQQKQQPTTISNNHNSRNNFI